MRLTLTYDGPLEATNDNNKRLNEKNRIRRQLHQQLREVWLNHPAVEGLLKVWEGMGPDDRYSSEGNHSIVAQRTGDYTFIPLVVARHFMVCDLDILFLRREHPGALIHGGDLDNRLKTLLDAFSMPSHTSQLRGLGENEPSPFFCLLQDDRLVTGLNVKTSQLFEPVPPNGNVSDVRLVIGVGASVTRLTYANMGVAG